MFLQIWYNCVDAFHYINCHNKLLNKMKPSQKFAFLWPITNFLSPERHGLCKDPVRTLCFLPEEMDLSVGRDWGDSTTQDLLWEKAQPLFVTEGSGSGLFRDSMCWDKSTERNNHRFLGVLLHSESLSSADVICL